MQLKPLKTIGQQNPQKISSRVSAICWSPNNRRFAVADCDNMIHLYDDSGERKDKFQTKPSNPQVRILFFIGAWISTVDT
jgi:intraflagellar transport protein 172